MEHFEYMDTILTEYQEILDQEAFEEDMRNDPYADSRNWPPEQEDDPDEEPDEGPFDEMGFDPYEGCYTWDC